MTHEKRSRRVPREGVDFSTYQPGNRQSGWNWFCLHCTSAEGRGWRGTRVDARRDARGHATSHSDVTAGPGSRYARAAATAALGELSALFLMAARGRRQFLRSIEGDERFGNAAELLRIEIRTLESVTRVIEGELGPLYDWLPSHLWTKEMLSRLYAVHPAGEAPVVGADAGGAAPACCEYHDGEVEAIQCCDDCPDADGHAKGN